MEKLINDFKICFTKGDTYALAVKFKNITEDLSKAQFTVKENPDDVPLIQKALGTGISKIDDRAYKQEKTYKVQIQANDTVFLEAGVQYLYDLQVTIGNVVKTVLSGVFVVNHSVSGVSSATTSALEVSAIDEVETEFATTPATVGLEYESDPVALAKIGDLSSLETEVKSTVVGAINATHGRLEETYNNVESIMSGTTAVGIARRATIATSAEYASRTGAINWFTPTDERIDGSNIPLRAEGEITLASKDITQDFGAGYEAYKLSGKNVALADGQTVYVQYAGLIWVKGTIMKHPNNTSDASLYFVYYVNEYPYALTLNKTYKIGRAISVENAKQADNATKATSAYSATTATTATQAEAIKTTGCTIRSEGGKWIAKIPSGATGLYFVRFRLGAEGIDDSGFIYIGDTNTDAMGAIVGQCNDQSTVLANYGVLGTIRLCYSHSNGGIVGIQMLVGSAPLDNILGTGEFLILSANRIDLVL